MILIYRSKILARYSMCVCVSLQYRRHTNKETHVVIVCVDIQSIFVYHVHIRMLIDVSMMYIESLSNEGIGRQCNNNSVIMCTIYDRSLYIELVSVSTIIYELHTHAYR